MVFHSFELPTTAFDTQETMGIYCKMEEKAGRGRWAVGSGAPWGSPAELGSAVGEGGRRHPPPPTPPAVVPRSVSSFTSCDSVV